MTERILKTLAETESLARDVARQLRPGDCVTLSGDLGVGKTAFAKALIGSIAITGEEIVSPTFTLVQPYPVRTAGGECTLYHCDLYRLKQAEEWLELGVEEEMEAAIAVIEWPEIIAHRLPAHRLDIALGFGEAESVRTAKLHGVGRWQMAVDNINR